ncbi:MAG: type II secretion system protein GspJ [Phycisphaeraceae bacterium]
MDTKTPNISTRKATGFTLLELVLALTVTAIVSVALFTSMSGAFKARRQVEDNLAGREAARWVLATVRTDLQCVPPAGGRISGVFAGEDNSGMNNADADRVLYVTANPNLKSDQDLGDLRQVELRLLESADDPDHYVLARLVTGNLLARATPEPTVQVLARRVVSFNVQYFDGGEWLDEWDSTLRDNALPLAVEIVLVLAPERDREPDDEDEDEKQAGYITMSQVVRLPASRLESSDGGINLGF